MRERLPSVLAPAARAAGTLRITARADYAVRAAVELAAAYERGWATKGDAIARAQAIPLRFLEQILIELRHSGLVRSQRGTDGGYWLARPPDEISVADVIRAVEGPLASVRGHLPEQLGYDGRAEPLQTVWIAVRGAVRDVVEHVTLADIASADLPERIRAFAEQPGAWHAR